MGDTNNHRISVWTKTGPTTWVPVTTFGSSERPFGVAVSADGQTLWAGNPDPDHISVWERGCPAQ